MRLALAASCSRQAVQKVCWQASVLGSLNVSMQIGQTSSCRAAWTRVRDLSREEEYASLSTSDIIFALTGLLLLVEIFKLPAGN